MATRVDTPVHIEEKICDLNNLKEDSERIRASLFNLILVCHTSHRLEYFHSVIEAIIDKFPCRIILVQLDNSGADHFETEMSLLKVHHGEDTIECDQTVIKAGGKDIQRVSFFILPLLVPDLPFMLVWGQDPTLDHELLPQLQRYANRLIFDSESVADLQEFGKNLLDDSSFKQLDLVDLNWTRIGGWREVMAKAFDTPDRIRQLTQATEITITYNGLEDSNFHHCGTQATYLQAWLAARLKWHLRSQRGNCVTYDNGNSVLQVHLVPKQLESKLPGSIHSVEVAVGDAHHYMIQRKKGFDQVVVYVSSLETCELPFSINLRTSQPGYGFLKEVFYSYGSDHYREMLHILTQQSWKS